MEATLWQQAECFLGAEIQPSEWDKAAEQAEGISEISVRNV